MATGIRIAKFFELAGLSLRVVRTSWGASDDDLVLLRTWSDEWDQQNGEVPVLRPQRHPDQPGGFGLKERLWHLNRLWSGELPGYTAIATSSSRKHRSGSSKPFSAAEVYPIRRLRVEPGGEIRAVLGKVISLESMRAHARTHKTRVPRGPLPLNEKLQSILDRALGAAAGVDPRNSKEFKSREARFAMVQVRPEQPTFRLAVFAAYFGKCLLTDCEVPEAVEAAHLHGRDWREGHNSAADGILLRRDVHALYDRKLLHIAEDGVVTVDSRIAAEYGDLEQVVVKFRT